MNKIHDNQLHILDLLGEGEFCSGQALAKYLGISRSAVWKRLQLLSAKGVSIEAIPGKGYRLTQPMELLMQDKVTAAIDPLARDYLQHLEIFEEIDSTNRYLMQKARGDAPSGSVCLAERQSEGRGRRGRPWISPYASNIYLSLLWRFNKSPSELGGLAIAAGVAVGRCLDDLGVVGFSLKWPNDVMWQKRKLAGILLEMSGEASGPCAIVAGVGLNVSMRQNAAQAIDQAWADLNMVLGESVSRNRVAGLLLQHLLVAFAAYSQHGLSPFAEQWRRWDGILDKQVRLTLPHQTVTGIARGIDAVGGLRLECNGSITVYHAGEISLREVKSE